MTASYNLVTQTVSLTWTPEEAAQIRASVRAAVRARIRSAFASVWPVRRVLERTIKRRQQPAPMVFKDGRKHETRGD